MSQGKLARNTLFLTAASVGQKVIAFLYFSVIARTIGVESLGAYFIALAMVTTIGVLDDLGLTYVVIREVAKAPEKAKHWLQNVIGIKLITMPLTVVVAFLLPGILGYDGVVAGLVRLAVFIMLADTLSLTFYGVLRGMQRLKYESIGVFVGQALSTIVGATFLFTDNASLPLLVGALITGSVWNALFAGGLLVRRLGVEAFIPKFTMGWEPLKASFAFFLSAVFVKIYSYVDSFMLKDAIGDVAVGLYSVAYKLTYAFQFLPIAFAGALYPTLSVHANNKAELRRIFLDAEWYMALLATPIAFGIFALAPEIIDMFYGAEYAAAGGALAVLIFVLPFIFLDWPIGSLLNATGRQSVKTLIMGSTMVVNIVANFLLIPRLGIVGASAAALVSFVFMFAAGWVAIRRSIDVDMFDLLKKTGGLFTAGVVMAVAVELLKHVMPWVLTVPLGAIVFFGVALLTKAFTFAHVRQFKALLRPAKSYAANSSSDV